MILGIVAHLLDHSFLPFNIPLPRYTLQALFYTLQIQQVFHPAAEEPCQLVYRLGSGLVYVAMALLVVLQLADIYSGCLCELALR